MKKFSAFVWIGFLITIAIIGGCQERATAQHKNAVLLEQVYDGTVINVYRFKDGDVTCYVAGGRYETISCVR